MSDKKTLTALSEQPAPDHAGLVLALKPFAKASECFGPSYGDDYTFDGGVMSALPDVTVGDLRRAREAIAALSSVQEPVATSTIDERLDTISAKLAVDEWFRDGNENRKPTEIEAFQKRVRTELLHAACELARPYRDRAVEAEQKLAALATPPAPQQGDIEQIKRMVDRFLSWKLPENFNPDGGISFDRVANLGTEHQYYREPVGTNLFDYMQAEAMVRYMLASPAASQGGADQ